MHNGSLYHRLVSRAIYKSIEQNHFGKRKVYLSYGEKTLEIKSRMYTYNGMDLVLSDDTNLTVGYSAVAQGYADNG